MAGFMIAGSGQTVADVAVVVSGSAEAAWDIALLSGVSLTDAIQGMELTIPAHPADADTAAAMMAAGANPATDGTVTAVAYKAIGEAKIGTNIIA